MRKGAARFGASPATAFPRGHQADEASAETTEAYRTLCEPGVLERADYLPPLENSDCFRVRVALLGDNETRYRVPTSPKSPAPVART